MTHVLLIAGSDSSGGAGISRDLRTLSDLGLVGVPVITAVTAQTHGSVQRIHPVPADVVEDQIVTALASNPIRAIKIGMLGTRQIVEAVAKGLPSRDKVPIVLDPVLAASSGRALIDEEGRRALIDQLFPRVTLITPNIPEAAVLLGEHSVGESQDDRVELGRGLLALGPQAVLIKGGHANGTEAIDLLITSTSEVVSLSAPRRPGTQRGTGCALSSGIAAGLAQNRSLIEACRGAKRHVTGLWPPQT